MATLSKMVMAEIARKMTEKSRKFADATLREYQELATVMYEEQLPEEVLQFFKKYPDYTETAQSLYLDGHGFNRESVSMTRQLPAASGYNVKLKLTAAIGEKLIKAKRKMQKAKDDYKQLLQETESALAALKTNKNIRENLPEAAPFLPPPMSNSLVVNFDSLQKRLQNQPKTSEAIKEKK